MLTGRWWEGRILINLCSKNNVRNCDLLQSDFFAVLGVAKGFLWRVVILGKNEVPKRCDFLRLRNMLLKSTFPTYISGWSKRHQRSWKSGCSSERRAINSWVSRTHHYLNIIYFIARRSEEQSIPIVSQNAATTPAKNRLKPPCAWQTPSNCRHFHDNLYQIQFSDCSALPESRLQSLPHPYSPLRASAFFRISRNPGPGKLSISQKSFGMKLTLSQKIAKNRKKSLKIENAAARSWSWSKWGDRGGVVILWKMCWHVFLRGHLWEIFVSKPHPFREIPVVWKGRGQAGRRYYEHASTMFLPQTMIATVLFAVT